MSNYPGLSLSATLAALARTLSVGMSDYLGHLLSATLAAPPGNHAAECQTE
jgi:hypothetical protein